MKIEKGRTVEQFISSFEEKESDTYSMANHYENIDAYNNRLKDALTKDMFINPYDKPLYDNYETLCQFNANFNRWQDAENKVIFDGKMISDVYYLNNNIKYNFHDMIRGIETLGDIFRATNGELTLKNFEI